MYFIAMNAVTSEVILSKRSNMDPVTRTRERTRAILTEKFPGRTIYSPLERVPAGGHGIQPPEGMVLVTIYKSRRKDGIGRTCGTFETWAVV